MPAGLALISGRHPRFLPKIEDADLVAGDTAEITLELEPNRETAAVLAKQLEVSGTATLYGIYFDTDRAELKPESEAMLVQLQALLAERPSLRLVVAGHTDSEGTEAHNQDLAERRSRAVVAWLIARRVAAGRLEPVGFGESQPVADNRSPQGRALNRRVEIREAGR